MSQSHRDEPMRIKISDERRQDLIRAIQAFFLDTYDEDLSAFKSGGILDFFVKQLGPPVYNQAIQDARAHMQDRLDDLEGDFYEPELP